MAFHKAVALLCATVTSQQPAAAAVGDNQEAGLGTENFRSAPILPPASSYGGHAPTGATANFELATDAGQQQLWTVDGNLRKLQTHRCEGANNSAAAEEECPTLSEQHYEELDFLRMYNVETNTGFWRDERVLTGLSFEDITRFQSPISRAYALANTQRFNFASFKPSEVVCKDPPVTYPGADLFSTSADFNVECPNGTYMSKYAFGLVRGNQQAYITPEHKLTLTCCGPPNMAHNDCDKRPLDRSFIYDIEAHCGGGKALTGFYWETTDETGLPTHFGCCGMAPAETNACGCKAKPSAL